MLSLSCVSEQLKFHLLRIPTALTSLSHLTMALQKRKWPETVSATPKLIKRQKSKPPPLSTTLSEANAIIVTFQRPATDFENGSIHIECLESRETFVVCNGSAISLDYGDTFESTDKVDAFEVVVGTQKVTYSWPARMHRESSDQETIGTLFSRTPFQVYETSTAPTTAATVQTTSTITQGPSKSNLENNSPQLCSCGKDIRSEFRRQHENFVDFHGRSSPAPRSIGCREASGGTMAEHLDCDTAANDSEHGTRACSCVPTFRRFASRRASV